LIAASRAIIHTISVVEICGRRALSAHFYPAVVSELLAGKRMNCASARITKEVVADDLSTADSETGPASEGCCVRWHGVETADEQESEEQADENREEGPAYAWCKGRDDLLHFFKERRLFRTA
jgi:hypothetical protein